MSQPKPTLRSAEGVRVRRTKRLLREALVELIEEQGFEKATVSQITERALISRAAFYRAYRDKYQLAEQVFEEAVAELIGGFSHEDPEGGSPQRRWTAFFAHIAGYERFYRAMLGRNGGGWFARRMRDTLALEIARHLGAEQGPGRDDPTPALVAAMYTELITWWLEQSRPWSAQRMAAHTSALTQTVVRETTSWPGSHGKARADHSSPESR
ncbi:AcrR family transcriptional regulator [Streptacidiphilus sp. MAP12-33]|uniref:TetR/AcrR family transcriptional regulator n=1 Tax=Streptacidiphilus sp. MAP12-33 TaxID=3156266 RepID=UPI003516D74C